MKENRSIPISHQRALASMMVEYFLNAAKYIKHIYLEEYMTGIKQERQEAHEWLEIDFSLKEIESLKTLLCE